MLAKRIIPCLDVRDGMTVKGVNFLGLKDVGDPVSLGEKYAAEGADELVFLDISATLEGRKTFAELVGRIADRISIPFTVGGGISDVDDAARLLDAGADKITVNSAALRRPELVDEIAGKYGSQFVIVAIDAKRVAVADGTPAGSGADAADGTPVGSGADAAGTGRWMATTHGGTRMTDRELVSWAREAQERGAGEILFTSMDHDGTKKGYPCDVYAELSGQLSIPVIASGGAGSIRDIYDVLTEGKADAALAASIFHYGEIPIPVLKKELDRLGVPVRLDIR